MDLILIISLALDVAAIGWSLMLLQRTREWRLGFLPLLLGILVLRQTLGLAGEEGAAATVARGHAMSALPDLVVGIMAFLYSNAEHAMRHTGGMLEVRLTAVEVPADVAAAHPPLQPGPHLRLTVADTGSGMTPEIVERIFEPFFTTKEAGEGTGLGLAMVHGIIADHEGAITVQSTPGRGTTFDLYLPRSACVAVDERAEDAPPKGEERILFVDDEAPLVRLGQHMLERLGYEVLACRSSAEALEAFQTAPQEFDLVITDQIMPQMTGEALARALRQIRPEIPVIICTGFSHALTAEKAAAVGINAYLMKPLVSRELGLAIRQVLDQCNA